MNQLLNEIRSELRRLGTAEGCNSTQRFHKPDERVNSYGVAAPEVHRIARNVYRCVKSWSVAERDRLCTELWQSGKNEEGALACYLYRGFGRHCGAREFRMFARWIDRYVHNWGHTDGVSLWLLGASIANEPGLIDKLDPWTRSKNRWKRRAAAVALVPSARRGLHTSAILRIAQRLIADADDMVQKGVGWLLKETYPKRPVEVVRFLVARSSKVPRLVLRYAAEKMRPADRARVLMGR